MYGVLIVTSGMALITNDKCFVFLVVSGWDWGGEGVGGEVGGVSCVVRRRNYTKRYYCTNEREPKFTVSVLGVIVLVQSSKREMVRAP